MRTRLADELRINRVTTHPLKLKPDENGADEFPAALTSSVRERLVRLAYRFVWDSHKADDVVQDALATAHARRETLADQRKWWSWLCRIVVHRCHEEGRRVQRVRRHEQRLGDDLRSRAATGSGVEQQELRECVRQLLTELPDREREVLVLRHLEQMSYEEVGEVLGIAASTARVHARVGRESLRSMLQRRHPAWFAELSGSGGGSQDEL